MSCHQLLPLNSIYYCHHIHQQLGLKLTLKKAKIHTSENNYEVCNLSRENLGIFSLKLIKSILSSSIPFWFFVAVLDVGMVDVVIGSEMIGNKIHYRKKFCNAKKYKYVYVSELQRSYFCCYILGDIIVYCSYQTNLQSHQNQPSRDTNSYQRHQMCSWNNS